MAYSPPYKLTSEIVSLVEEIGERIGRYSLQSVRDDLKHRRIRRVQTIQGSLAIEGNTLTEEEILTVLEGKTVIAPPKEIQEVRNAIKVYDSAQSWDPSKESDLLKAHQILTTGLLDSPGQYRKKAAGVMGSKGSVVHIAPPADRVPVLMKDLFHWLRNSREHPLITSSLFHYEFEFIHPFEDGNGRMGRLWQSLILSKWNPLFEQLPVENLIFQRQQEYYDALNASNGEASATAFLTFLLTAIRDQLDQSLRLDVIDNGIDNGIENRRQKLVETLRKNPTLSQKQLATLLSVSSRTIARDLEQLKAAGVIQRKGPAKGGYWE